MVSIAREYFESARSAQRHIDARLAALQAMRVREGVRAQRYDSPLPRGGGSGDAMRATDRRMDAEARMESELADYRRAVEDARAVCSGIRAANPNHPVWGDALELHYIDLMPWKQISACLGLSEDHVRRSAYAALDWVDAVGIASAREGCGQAQLV